MEPNTNDIVESTRQLAGEIRGYRDLKVHADGIDDAANEIERLQRQVANLLDERALLLTATRGLNPEIVGKAMELAANTGLTDACNELGMSTREASQLLGPIREAVYSASP